MTSSAGNARSPEASGKAGNALFVKVRRIAEEVARPAASRVDKDACFPREAVSALREEKLLAAAIPVDLGGMGCPLGELARFCAALGKACASTGMIFAMHQMQIACIVRHCGTSAFFRDYLRDAADRQWLLASGTSEAGIGGDLRSSIAAIDLAETDFKLSKSCTTLSYGEHADGILITARHNPAAASGDQSLALIRKEDYTLKKTGEWDALGMRGTCSPPFNVSASAAAGQILPEPFRDIAIQTMIPETWALKD